MPHRKAASVLPEPVGAKIRVCSPRAIAGHPCSGAAVGDGKLASNQARTGGENTSSAIRPRLPTRTGQKLSGSDLVLGTSGPTRSGGCGALVSCAFEHPE